MILAAERAFFCSVTNLDHEVDQVLNREDVIIQNWVLRVDGLDERPILVDKFNIVRIHPKVACEHEVQEEFFREACIVYKESELGEELDRLAVNREDIRVGYW